MFFTLVNIAKYLNIISYITKDRKIIIISNTCFLIIYWVLTIMLNRHTTDYSILRYLTFLIRHLEILFLFFCFIIIHRNKFVRNWKLLVKELKRNYVNQTNRFMIVILLVFHTLIICIISSELYAHSKRLNRYQYMSWAIYHINQYLHFFSSFLIYQAIKIILEKYNRLNILFEKTFEKKIKFKKSNEKLFYEILLTYRNYFILIEDFNAVFGYPILIIFAVTLQKLVNAVSYGIYATNYKSVFVVTGILQIFLYLVKFLIQVSIFRFPGNSNDF